MGWFGSRSEKPDPLRSLCPLCSLWLIFFALRRRDLYFGVTATAGVEAGVPLRVPGGTDFLASA